MNMNRSLTSDKALSSKLPLGHQSRNRAIQGGLRRGGKTLRLALVRRDIRAACLVVALSGLVSGFGCTDATDATTAAPGAAQSGGPTRPGLSTGDGADPANDDAGTKPDGGADARASDSGSPQDAGKDTGSKGSNPDPAAECVELDACCDDLGSSMYSGCKSIVSSNYAASCTSALDGYHGGGYCTGGTSCSTLATCCSTLPSSWKSSCDSYVDLNNDGECQRLVGQYQTSGYCGGGPSGACTSLHSCCLQVPSGYYATCEWYVTAGSQTDCSTMHSTYKNGGLCN